MGRTLICIAMTIPPHMIWSTGKTCVSELMLVSSLICQLHILILSFLINLKLILLFIFHIWKKIIFLTNLSNRLFKFKNWNNQLHNCKKSEKGMKLLSSLDVMSTFFDDSSMDSSQCWWSQLEKFYRVLSYVAALRICITCIRRSA